MKEEIAPSTDSEEQYSYELKIPKDRVAVLIGKKGETKKELEEFSKASINIDSREGEVVLTGSESIMLYSLKEVIRAIARGFNPEVAKLLFRQDYSLEIIHLSEFNEHKSHQLRLKGRVIGRNGKSRSTIEDMTNCYISVYGKTIAILGSVIEVPIAKKAVESLLIGSMHASVYKWLEKQKRILLGN
jgi:ribosomal RNA assembly protein